MKARLLSALLGAATLALASHGSAFCRATTCDPSKAACERDSSSCLVTGTPLFWASSCFQVYVQADGAPKQGISFATAKESVSRAFTAWLSADCGGAAPLIDVQVLGPITCDTAEYNKTQKNANIVLFREDEWPYVGAEDALGFTHLTFNADTGELWDADLEINAVSYRFSVGDPVTDNDLDSMLTHEAGHMLGLAHTLVTDATMFGKYTAGTESQRTLADDDVQAVCATYPANRSPSRPTKARTRRPPRTAKHPGAAHLRQPRRIRGFFGPSRRRVAPPAFASDAADCRRRILYPEFFQLLVQG
jgi:hypothetical protein